MIFLSYFLLLTLTFFDVNVAAEDTVVQLPKGKIRGHILKSGNGKPYYAFQEIPYAAPPIGENRYKLIKEHEPWSGILNTTSNKVICYQSYIRYKNLSISEDCLFMNIYTPVIPGGPERLPVMLWIHGGGFSAESSGFAYSGPKYIIDNGVVIVTFNYRLGPFGFLTTNDDVIPANLGFKDQLFASEWVQQNIELFGGNSSHVTLIGESAGSMAVGLHLLGPWPSDKVLYHAAIMQSGSTMYYTRGNNARKTAFDIGRGIDKTFSSNSSSDLLKLLQSASAEDILKVGSPPPWPIVEQSGPFSYHMFDCMVNGNFKKLPLLIGFNSEEWLDDAVHSDLQNVTTELDIDPSKMFESKFNLSRVNRTIAGNLLRRVYTNTTFMENVGAYVRFDSDNVMCTPITKQVAMHSKYVDLYFYQFAYKGPLGNQMALPNITGCEHVTHAEDLKYFWADETNSDLSVYPERDQQMLHQYIKALTNFVKYHNPTPEKDPLLQNVTWTKVDPNTPDDIQYLNFNSTLEMRSNPRYYQKVKKIYDYYITPEVII